MNKVLEHWLSDLRLTGSERVCGCQQVNTTAVLKLLQQYHELGLVISLCLLKIPLSYSFLVVVKSIFRFTPSLSPLTTKEEDDDVGRITRTASSYDIILCTLARVLWMIFFQNLKQRTTLLRHEVL